MNTTDKVNITSSKLYNITYYDDFNRKHLAFGVEKKDLYFYYDRYGKNNVKTINFV